MQESSGGGQGLGSGENEEMLVKQGAKFPLRRMNNSGSLTDSMVAVVDNAVEYTVDP